MKTKEIVIPKPTFQTSTFPIVGTAPLVMHKFSEKAKKRMMDDQMAGSQKKKKGTKKEPRDFDAEYEAAKHISTEGWIGMPAGAFRAAMISACRLVGFKMTVSKLALFIEADGVSEDEGMPLVRIIGEPEPFTALTRIMQTVNIAIRPMFKQWRAKLRVRFDADIFGEEDIANLVLRAGMQVGIGEGRPDSKKSAGQGWGLFEIAGLVEK